MIVPNWDQLEKSFDATQFGRLVNDPVMKPFVDDFDNNSKTRLARLEKIGVTLDDLREVPGGEIAIGVALLGKDQAALMMVIDITGHEANATALRKKIAANLAKQGARRTQRSTNDISEYEMPRQEGETKAQIVVNAVRTAILDSQ